jgi:transposase-like protein
MRGLRTEFAVVFALSIVPTPRSLRQARRDRFRLRTELIQPTRRPCAFHSKDVTAKTLAQYIRENLSPDAEVIFTDDYPSYPSAVKRAGMEPKKHKAINHSKRICVIGDTHTNTIESAFSLFKGGICGTWHHVSAKHLAAYLEEMEFRFNNRKNRSFSAIR